MTARREYHVVLGALCALLSWFTVYSWSAMVEDPGRFLGPTFTAALIVAVIGASLRTLGIPWWGVLAAQLLALTAWLHHRLGAGDELGGWLPTRQGLRFVAEQIRDGASQVNTYSAPIEADQVQAPVYLLATALAVVIAVDLLAGGLHRAPWAGLPVLVAVTVPISVLDSALPKIPLAGAAATYLALIAYARTEEVLGWGQRPESPRDVARPSPISAGPAFGIGILTTLAALTLPAFVPVGSGVLGSGGDGTGPGSGAGSITLENPLVDLRRDLQRDANIPLLDATTAAAPDYLRMTVLDRFNGSSWVPGPRKFPVANRVGGELPDPEGITAQTPGNTSEWLLRTSTAFRTSWLPLPSVTRSLAVDRGDWRYDSTTLDVANTDDRPPGSLSYSAVGFAPTIEVSALVDAGPTNSELQAQMTRVPNLDAEVTAIARRVTAGARTDYARAARLQRWFRTTGGFTYSLDPAPGAGMEQLVRFLTTDKIGYCEQYAAAMAVMARALGIPARVVVGFLKPTVLSPGSYRYTSSDLHAWTEIYFGGTGWVRFEPTPGARTGSPPSWTLDDVPAPAPVAPTPTPTRAPPSTPATPQPQDQVVSVESSSAQPVVVGILVALALVTLTLLPGIVRRGQRGRRTAAREDARAEVEDLWRELRATATDLRVKWPEGRSARSVALTLAAASSPTDADLALLDALVALVERARYRHVFDLDEQERATARAAVQRWSALLALAASRRAVRSARWFPRSTLSRAGTATRTRTAERDLDLTEVR